MTFANQSRRTLVLGLVALGFGFGLLMLLPFVGDGMGAHVLAWLSLLGMFAGSLLLFVGFGRWIHRLMWQSAIRHSTLQMFGRTHADRMLNGALSPFWRWWLWITPSGEDRDAYDIATNP
ncbi:hypothetical protein [Neogemmobacter tilapiae]|uniref:Uncharacterized protein n=1 Tax=Neogemmobacter tilapiae TaxID=875041 RepID=A0A918TLR9_9RHOB|nr:hypothetical protein [Gemmobacter tilapiae]GHC52565.1 hypothetical protein GCM10007315_13820 [Gemmobacter tilapiae]